MNGTVQDSLGVVTYDGIKSKVGVENMQVTPSSNKMGDYLKSDDVIDYEKQSIAQLAYFKNLPVKLSL